MAAPAPVITIYKNGDHHFLGKKLVVNRKHYRNFENFLDKVTEDTRAGVAVRKIHTPHHGTRIASLENIQNGAIYVAAGPEKFKRLSYDKIGEHLTAKHNNIPIRPVVHSKINVTSRYKKEAMAEPLRNRIIYVYRNGEEKSPPVKLLLDKRTLKDMNAVLQYISNKINLTAGAVKCLYCLDTGAKVSDVTEINTNMLYVAVGTGKHFVKAKYNESGDKLISPKQKTTHTNKLPKNKKINELKPIKHFSEENEFNVVQGTSILSPIQTSQEGNSEMNFMDEVLESAGDIIEKEANDVNQVTSNVASPMMSPMTSPDEAGEFIASEIVQFELTDTASASANKDDSDEVNVETDKSDLPIPTKPIIHKHDEHSVASIKDERGGTPDHVDEPVTKNIANELSGTPPVSESFIHSGNELSRTPDIKKPINNHSGSESVDDELTDSLAINDPLNLSDGHVTESMESKLSGSPDRKSPINEDETISESVENELSHSLKVDHPVNMSDEQVHESVENELSGTPEQSSPVVDDDNVTKVSVYNASGKQQESGELVKDDQDTAVEELIDSVPAAEVEEELDVKE